MMPLAMANPGEGGTIRQVTGKDDVRLHLAALGSVAGQPVTVVAKLAGSVILNIRGTRVALDKKLAARVMI